MGTLAVQVPVDVSEELLDGVLVSIGTASGEGIILVHHLLEAR